MIRERLPTILLVVFLVVLGIVVFCYNAYTVWFRPSKYQARFVKAYEHIPKWFPFREFIILRYSSPSFILISRIIYLVSALILILAFIIFFIMAKSSL